MAKFKDNDKQLVGQGDTRLENERKQKNIEGTTMQEHHLK